MSVQNGEHVIKMDGVKVQYGDQTVLNDIQFELRNGEFCYLIGKTGSGKSSFLKLLYREIKPTTGSVRVADMDLSNLPDRKVPLLRRRLGIIFQDFQLLPDRNAYENVAFSLKVTGHKSSVIKEKVMEALGQVGLSHKRRSMPNDLSGGEQQRVVIARALVNEPGILLADEPTGNLDPEASRSIMDLLTKINHRGMAILMVTHDYNIVRRYPNRITQIRNGSLVEKRLQ